MAICRGHTADLALGHDHLTSREGTECPQHVFCLHVHCSKKSFDDSQTKSLGAVRDHSQIMKLEVSKLADEAR